jgi:hypothetical protein
MPFPEEWHFRRSKIHITMKLIFSSSITTHI